MFANRDNSRPIELGLVKEGYYENQSSSPTQFQTATEPSVNNSLFKGHNKDGIYYSLLMSMAAVCNGCLSRLVPGVSPFQMLLLRAFFVLIPFLIYFFYTKKLPELRASFTPLMICVGVSNAFGNAFFYFAVLKLSISETITVYSSSAIMNGVLASIFLGEPYRRIEKVLGAICFVGVILIVRPPFIFGSEAAAETVHSTIEMSRFTAGILAMLSMLFNSLGQVSNRAFKIKWHPTIITFYVNLSQVVLFQLFLMFSDQSKSLSFREYFMILLMAISNVVAVMASAKALELEKPSIVGLISYSQLVFSLAADLIFFGDVPSFTTIIGAGLIVGSCIYLIRNNE